MKPHQWREGLCCEKCLFWDDYGDEEDAKPREGACCRFPPQHNGKEYYSDEPMHQSWSFPVTSGHWVCGEFKEQA